MISTEEPELVSCAWDIHQNGEIVLENNGLLKVKEGQENGISSEIVGLFEIRYRKGGEIFKIAGGRSKSLKKIFQEPENIDLPNGSTYLFENTQPIWSVKDVEERVKLSKEFCSKIASARYCFAPRGVGSSSFRLYQSLMVGTVPIIYGMKDRPFEDVLDWSDFSIDGDYCSLTGSLEVPSEKDYECMRERGITIWDQYFHMQKTDEYLFQKYLETKE